MKISNKTKYGFQFMVHLAVQYGERYVNLKDIANQESISIKFLENIVSLFKPHDLIKVKRGALGGYKLNRPPQEISLLQIFEILDGEVLPLENEKSEIAITNQMLWKGMRENILALLESKNLEDLVKLHNDRKDNVMFYI